MSAHPLPPAATPLDVAVWEIVRGADMVAVDVTAGDIAGDLGLADDTIRHTLIDLSAGGWVTSVPRRAANSTPRDPAWIGHETPTRPPLPGARLAPPAPSPCTRPRRTP